jgi:hypothetical protein
MTKNLVEDSIKIIYDVKIFVLNKFEISGMWDVEIMILQFLQKKNKLILIIYNYLVMIMKNYH